jgi:uncharacterized protein
MEVTVTETRFTGRKLAGGKTNGEAIVSHEPMGFLNKVDRATGVFSQKNHELDGAVLTDKILVCPTVTGSTGDSFWIYEMSQSKTAPRGIINIKGDSVVAIGAIIGKIPMIDQVSSDSISGIQNGDYIELDADKGLAIVHSRRGRTNPASRA